MGDKMTNFERGWVEATQGAAYTDKQIYEEEYAKLKQKLSELEESIKNMAGSDKEDTQNKINELIKAIALKDANKAAFCADRDAIIESTEEILNPPTNFIKAVKTTYKNLTELVENLHKILKDLNDTNDKFEAYAQLIEANPKMYDRSSGKDNRKQWERFNTLRHEWFTLKLEAAESVLNTLKTNIPNDTTSDKMKSITMSSSQYAFYEELLTTRTANARSYNGLHANWYAKER